MISGKRDFHPVIEINKDMDSEFGLQQGRATMDEKEFVEEEIVEGFPGEAEHWELDAEDFGIGAEDFELGGEDLESEAEDFEDEAKGSGKWGCLIKLVALLVLMTFIAFSFLDVSYIFSGKLSFLNQNQDLKEDELVKLCKPAVVSIEAGTSRGTGFNISPEGTIVTNQHIVAGASQITIRFGDGRVFYTDRYQVIPGVDIALLKLQGNNQDLPFIAVNKEDQVQGGDKVTIIGNPLGFQKISQRGSVGQFHKLADSQALVFDIKISVNPGNSGSPVLNGKAQAVGIVFASATGDKDGKQESRALAIPVQVLP